MGGEEPAPAFGFLRVFVPSCFSFMTRLGVVSYLNTKPLVHAFESGLIHHDFELIYDVPSVCARKLHAGETDLALIPAIEIARSPEPYAVVPGVGITSRGPVRSVFLALNRDPEDVRTLALDTSSRSSVALSRILLEKQFGARVTETIEADPDVDAMLARADAAVVIGDIALELDRAVYRVVDLGEAWTTWTGLPFVYACWTGRAGVIDEAGCSVLREAKDLGLGGIDDISHSYATDHPHGPEFYAAYITEAIHYDLGEPELEGMRRYYAYAEELGLIEKAPEITFF